MTDDIEESVGFIEKVDEGGMVYLKESHGAGSLSFRLSRLRLPKPLVPKNDDEVTYSSVGSRVIRPQIRKFNERAHRVAEFDGLIGGDPASPRCKTEASTMCAAVHCVLVQSAFIQSPDAKRKYFELICRFISRVPCIEEPRLRRAWADRISPIIGLVPRQFGDVLVDVPWVRGHLETVKDAIRAVYAIRPTTTWIGALYVVSQIEPGFQQDVFESICSQKKYNPHSRAALPIGPGQGEGDGGDAESVGGIRAMMSIEGLKAIPLDRGYLSPKDFLDTNFNLLRADCFSSLAGNITLLNEGRKNDYIARDIPLYTDVEFDIIQCEKSIAYRITCTAKDKQMVQPPRLSFGNLLAISPSGEFRDSGDVINSNGDNISGRDIFWGMVEEEPTEEERQRAENDIKSSGRCRISFEFSFCRYANGDVENDGEAIQAIIKNFDKVAILDSDAFIIAYEPILNVLKNLSEQALPFKDEFVYARQTPHNAPPAEEQRALRSLVQERQDIYGTLDPGQAECYEHFVANRVALIQGPPGTGKSYLGTRIAYALNKVGYKSILIMSYKNHSLDDFVIDIHDILGEAEYKLGSIVRLGGNPKRDPKVAECSMDSLSSMLGNVINGDGSELSALKKKFLETLGEFKKSIKELEENFQVFNITYEEFTAIYKGEESLKKFFEEMKQENFNDDDDDDDEEEKKKGDSKEKIFDAWINKVMPRIRQKLKKDAPLSLSSSKKPWKKENGEEEEEMTVEEAYAQEVKDEEAEREAFLKLQKRLKEDEEAGKIVFEERADFQFKKQRQHKIKLASQKLLSSSAFDRSEFAKLYSVYSISTEEETREDLDGLFDDGVNNEDNRDNELSQENLLRNALLLKYEDALVVLGDVMVSMKDLSRRISEVFARTKARILKEASFVCCTSTGSGLFHELLKDIEPDALVIEESGEIPEPVLAAALYPTLKRIVMIGDHKQLRPSVNTYSLCEKNLNVSTFERLVRLGLPSASLYVQNRMLDATLWPVQMFYDRLESNPVITRRIEPAAWFTEPVFWWDHDHNEGLPGTSRSIYNLYEADRVEMLVGFLLGQDEYLPRDITVITPYSAQVAQIKRIFGRTATGNGVNGIAEVQVKTVDEFQGNESRIIILSLVRGFNDLNEDQEESTRSAARKTIGFLREENRLIVAVSRHKAALVIVGNSGVFRSDKNWGRLVEASAKRGVLSDSLVLKCPRHAREIVLKEPESLPLRGCTEPCGCIMECGHVCPGCCHDPKKVAHARCNVRINHTFPCGHTREMRCYEAHDEAVPAKCTETIVRTLKACGHRVICACLGVKDSLGKAVFEDPQECRHQCTRKRYSRCGHMCHMTCGHEGACKDECLVCKDAMRFSLSSSSSSRSKAEKKKKEDPGALTVDMENHMLLVMVGGEYSRFSMLCNYVFPVLDGRYVRTDSECCDGKVTKMQEEVLWILLEQVNVKPPEYFKSLTKIWPFLAVKECAEGGILENLGRLCAMYLPETCNVTKDTPPPRAKEIFREVSGSLETLTRDIRRVSNYIITRIKEGRNAPNYARWLDIPVEDAADILNVRLEVQDLDSIPTEAHKMKKSWGVMQDVNFERDQGGGGGGGGGEGSCSIDGDDEDGEPLYPTRAIPPKWEVPRSYLYKPENAEGYFVSIDIKKANFTILRLYEPEFVDYSDTWEEYVQHVIDVGKFDVPGGFEAFKHMREATLGKLSHEKIAALEGHVLRLIVRSIVCYYLENMDFGYGEIERIFAFSCDELLIKVRDKNALAGAYKRVVAAIRRFMPKAERFLRIEGMKLVTLGFTSVMKNKAVRFENVWRARRGQGMKFQQDSYGFNEEWKWREEKKPKRNETYYARVTLWRMGPDGVEVVEYDDETTEAAKSGLVEIKKRPPFVLKCIEREMYVDGVYNYIETYRHDWIPDIVDDDDSD